MNNSGWRDGLPIALGFLTAQQNLLLKSPSRPLLAVAVVFAVALPVSPSTREHATSTHVSHDEFHTSEDL